ncbi:MAG TPA: ankyrin repeat domain-containing protein [Candidatus Dormibacteraeota bacterium]|nr:ankyrin repeat domain-containing protein [Candidatus Dormibacteraeota bacterium]
MWPFKPKLDEFGRSELHYAARDGNSKLAQLLIGRGADANLADKNGWTPLHFAAQAQSAEVAALLLDAGAQVDPTDLHGNTPLFKAVFESKGSGDTIKLLRTRGANPLSENKHGQTPVGLARLLANHNVKQFFEDLP